MTLEPSEIISVSFSKVNAADLLGLLDGGQIKSVALLVSYYFKSTNREIYDSLIPPLQERGMRVLAMRNHAKMILAKMTDETQLTIESSANLRSCKNCEQFVLTNDRELYEFHHHWIHDELINGSENRTV